jgi:hypothetical protein
MKNFSKGLKKHIRKEKANVRRVIEEKSEQNEKIKNIISRFKKDK